MKPVWKAVLLSALIVSVGVLSACSGQKGGGETAVAAPETAAPAVAPATAVNVENYLPLAEVEKITGLTGLKYIPKDPSKGAGGDLNIAKADGTQILLATFQTVDPAEIRKRAGSAEFKGAFRGEVAGIGDLAFNGPAQGDPYVLTVLKGSHWFTLGGSLNPFTMKPVLTQDQMKALAEAVISHL